MKQPNTDPHVLVFNLIYTAEQLWIFHVLTRSYSEHKALGDIYDGVQSYKDAVTEILIGQEQITDLSGSLEFPFITAPANALSLLEDTKELLEEFFHEDSGWSCDLINMKDDMVGKINHTIYLLRLK